MGLLLDTHVLLWWLADAPELPEDVKERLDIDPDVHVSAVTIWEISLKQALGKLSGPSDLPEIAERAGFRALPVTSTHGIAAGRLPLLHRDPFDRMLVAQARSEGLTLATRDSDVQRYDVGLLRL
ncbi:type II toxin-antitoxin system VapC family toxin [Actinomycetospora termitidis]|uniref:Type II toxin-antitoxin system VapC family toxin n=1 Tax=Actinomycetospora termitidis TaxID=3053470 RepID=A0ABT7MAC7_9PSEU|nr:type II toxin-antitoxin system VapC family toxin [Actinomycetospora sp. Odt1-22]MDL5157606.1 type II toxin-antitoxin system VapC family toxin [Actinomycetospora sp. Odt1-22]